MHKHVGKKALAVIVLAVVVVLAGCSSGGTPSTSKPSGQLKSPSNGMVQSNSAGSVDVSVEWQGMKGDVLAFGVSMNTHSVDLDQIDLGKQAILRDDAGKEYRPASWSSAPGGHHRSGSLAFPVPDSLAGGKATYFEMIIRDVSGIRERALRWQL